MLDSTSSDADAARVALLPLECSLKDLDRLFTYSDESKAEFAERLEAYGLAALRQLSGPDEHPYVNSLGEIATFSALAAIRIEFADPLSGTRHYEQFPANSAERRMMERPLRNHPGLSRFTREIREQYIYDVLYAFQNLIGDELQREFVAILFAPDPELKFSSAVNPAGTYRSIEDRSGSVRSRYRDRVTRVNGGFKIPHSYVKGRTFIEPIRDSLYLPSPDFEDLPPLVRHNDGLVIPEDVVLAKLANYAWHAWSRLTHFAYNNITEDHIHSLVEMTPRISTEIRDHLRLRQSHRSFVPYYGSKTENPLMRPNAGSNVSKPDKRLVTVVDAIRASPDLSFGEPILLHQLFNEVRRFFPSPARPSNDVTNMDTLKNALDGAFDDRITSAEMVEAYEIPAPFPTPFYPKGGPTLWRQYRHELAELTQKSPVIPDNRRISPFLPEEWQPRESPDYATTLQKTEQAATTQQKYEARHLTTVEPLTNPSKIEGLSTDEVLFLTRVGLAMERQIKSYSLVESMRAFDETSDGERLDIDLEKLEHQEYVTCPPGRLTYYTVPQKTRSLLRIPNVSHDGWGERSPSEGTPHRVGIDLSAFYVASHFEVDRVVRYCDVWRLQNTTCWDAVSHLANKRLDVVGFSKGEPRIVVEVETKSGGKKGTREAVEKLGAFPDEVHRAFVTPSGKHLPSLMSRLPESEDFDFGATKKGGYRPADVRDELTDHGILGEVFDDLLTHTNLRNRLSEPLNRPELSEIIVGSI